MKRSAWSLVLSPWWSDPDPSVKDQALRTKHFLLNVDGPAANDGAASEKPDRGNEPKPNQLSSAIVQTLTSGLTCG
jgi:hypothetical protein